MATLTIDQLKALPFGYLTGADLFQFSSGQLLIHQYEVDNGSLQSGCDLAYSEVVGQLSTRYNIIQELQIISGPRCILLVKITAILAIRNILGNAQNISQAMKDNFTWADTNIYDIRNGQMNLILQEQSTAKVSVAELIPQSFLTLG